MNPNLASLLARLDKFKSNPRHAAVRASAEAVATAVAEFSKRSSGIAASRQYTEAGIKAAVRDLAAPALRAQHVATQPIRTLDRDIKAKRACLQPADPDKADLAGALERGEIRQHLRSLKPLEREALLMTTTDLRLVEAAVTAPPELSGFANGDIIDKIEARYIELKHPAEVAEIEALTELLAEAEAIVAVARNEARNIAQMEPREFEAVAAKVEAAVWLVGKPGEERVCEPGPDGIADYRQPTPDELVTGQRFTSPAEYYAARLAA
ncbi:hypothetical protein [Nitrobacter sp. JJSN]|uniref:hypothetical protein n=1 Tax=Nitrobacter sp. JJSN TaxID=3453033 RepID=UPI003F758C52